MILKLDTGGAVSVQQKRIENEKALSKSPQLKRKAERIERMLEGKA